MSRRAARVRRRAEEGRAAAGHRRHGRAGAAGRRGDRLACRQGRASVRRDKDGWNGFCVLHTAAARVGALDLGFVPAPGGRNARADGGAPARSTCVFLLGADEIDDRARRLRGLYRHPRRPRRAPRRRHPAGRRLSGEVRHLRQHRRPRADGGARLVPAGRRARGLGDPARAVGRARPQAALRFARRSCARRCSRRIRICSASTRLRRASLPTSARSRRSAARPNKAPFGSPGRRLLSHQSDRARVRRHGGMLGASPRATPR